MQEPVKPSESNFEDEFQRWRLQRNTEKEEHRDTKIDREKFQSFYAGYEENATHLADKAGWQSYQQNTIAEEPVQP